MNLRTSEERVRLLKVGINGKQIEKLYLRLNNITIIHGNLLSIIEK